ncbi:MAG: tetratricopeptide repeat protein [Acidobacteria bacterium]|nr:tetratricopeptide repeat protein [Acidobacteriota bacterium]
MLYFVWGFVQPAYSAAVTAVADAALRLMEAGDRVTSLVAAGSRIDAFSALRDDGLPATSYSADLLQFYLVLSLAFVIAYPGLGVRRRARATALTLAGLYVFQIVALLVTVENTYANALTAFAGRHYAPWESSIYRWAYELAAHLAIELLPAVVLVTLYARTGGFETLRAKAPEPGSPSDPPAPASPRRRRWSAPVAAAGIALMVGGAAMVGHLAKVRARRAEAACVRGFQSLLAGRSAEAQKLFASSIAFAPSFLEAHDGDGAARLAMGDAAGAADSYRAALAIDPNYFASRMGLGSTLQALGRDSDALEQFDRARALSPLRWEPEFNRAPVLARLHRSAESEEALTDAVRLGPQIADVRFALAKLLIASGRWCEAIPHLEAFLKLAPGSSHDKLVRDSIATGRKECGG